MQFRAVSSLPRLARITFDHERDQLRIESAALFLKSHRLASYPPRLFCTRCLARASHTEEARDCFGVKTVLAITTMSNRCLPAELLDTVADFLHDSRKALKNCCLVGKSWVPRTRKFLFASIRFRTVEDVESWKSTFPDPSTSPAHYAKALFIECPWAATVADAEEGGWIQTFSHVVHLEVKHMSGRGGEFVNYLVPFHGFSPAIKSLDLIYIPLPLSLVFDLIRSFPLLEDLCVLAAIRHVIGVNDGLEFDRQPTTVQSSRSPVFTGSLKLYGVNHIVSHFLSLPGGLHFREFDLTWSGEADISSTTLLVESCRSTLESLSIDYSIFSTSSPYLHPYY